MGNSFSTPKEVWRGLDKFVIGQERAEKALAVAVYNQLTTIKGYSGTLWKIVHSDKGVACLSIIHCQ
ncbi:hypothetical protein ACET3Z_019085 [Daucus carota]